MEKQEGELSICEDVFEVVAGSKSKYNRPETLASVLNRDVNEHRAGVDLNIPIVPLREELLTKLRLVIKEGKVVPL